MDRLTAFKKGETWYVCISHKGSKKCEDVGYIQGIPSLHEAIGKYLAGKSGIKAVQVMFLRNIMDEDKWFIIPVNYNFKVTI